MSKRKKQNRTALLIVRLTKAEFAEIKKRAKAAKTTTSKYVRARCLGDAQ